MRPALDVLSPLVDGVAVAVLLAIFASDDPIARKSRVLALIRLPAVDIRIFSDLCLNAEHANTLGERRKLDRDWNIGTSGKGLTPI
jgi:hypothetical protein